MKWASFPSRNGTDSRLPSGHPELERRQSWPFCELCFPLPLDPILFLESWVLWMRFLHP